MLTLVDDGKPAQLQSMSWYHWGEANNSEMSHPELGCTAFLNPENKIHVIIKPSKPTGFRLFQFKQKTEEISLLSNGTLYLETLKAIYKICKN